MENQRAIPRGYMTVGELAKKMGVTVRALHHYDKLGLLSPESESDGGYRLYTDKDVITLHQILAMKYMGFSLDAIKNWVIHLETPEEVAEAGMVMGVHGTLAVVKTAINLTLLFMLPKHFGLTGVWMAWPVTEGLAIFVSVFFLWKMGKRYHYL